MHGIAFAVDDLLHFTRGDVHDLHEIMGMGTRAVLGPALKNVNIMILVHIILCLELLHTPASFLKRVLRTEDAQ